MNVVKIILKVLLGIIRLPFTIWYVVVGLVCKICQLINRLIKLSVSFFGMKNENYYVEGETANFGLAFAALLTFEWASLVKFYHFKW